ncbi:phospholipid-binding protein MlaC [Thermodesulfobacteriota bacterium]
MVKRKLTSVIVLLFIGLASVGWAAQPLDELKAPIEEIVTILRDPTYRDISQREQQREEMWKVALNIFDFATIARGTLKRHRWKGLTSQQKQEFTDVFTRFVGNNYFNRIQGNYQDEQVVFLGQRMKSNSKALVETKILREEIEIPVDYSMWQRQGEWKIYNVYVEGVSLVGNYRNEFERFLQKQTPDQLIEQLKEKVAEQQEVAPAK